MYLGYIEINNYHSAVMFWEVLGGPSGDFRRSFGGLYRITIVSTKRTTNLIQSFG